MAGAITGILDESYQASGAVTKLRFVKLTGDQTVILNDTAAGTVKGVARTSIDATEATNGKSTAVQVLGVAWVEAGGTVNRNDEVTTDNVGRAVAAASTNLVHGRCLKGGASGAWILVELALNNYIKA